MSNLLNFIRLLRSRKDQFTVVIPASAYDGEGVRYLSDLLATIRMQTIQSRIIIVDHSIDFALSDFIRDLSQSNIFYFRNRLYRGNWCVNANLGLRLANIAWSKYIKIMFQDDVLIDSLAFENISRAFQRSPEKGWVCHSSSHFLDPEEFIELVGGRALGVMDEDRIVIPEFNMNRLMRMENQISCPSAVTFKHGVKVFFDRNLILGGDCEFYLQLFKKTGSPILLSIPLTSNREHNSSVTQMIRRGSLKSRKRFIDGRKVRNRKDLLIWEILYMERKYSSSLHWLKIFPMRIMLITKTAWKALNK
jgi:hypothetical protein